MYNPYKMAAYELTAQIKYTENMLQFYLSNSPATTKALWRKDLKLLKSIQERAKI